MARVFGSQFCFRSVPLQFVCKSWPETVMGLYCWTFERIKTRKIVWSRGTVAWDMLQNQITMGKPVVGGSESPFRTKAHPTSSWSAPIMINTSQLSFIQQGKKKIKLWELTIRVAVSVFYLEREGPQDYASGVAIRSWLLIVYIIYVLIG